MPADTVRSSRIPMNVVFVVRVAVYTENVVFFMIRSSDAEVYRSLLFLSAGGVVMVVFVKVSPSCG